MHANATDLYRYAYWLYRDVETAERLVSDAFHRTRRALENTPNHRHARCGLFKWIRGEHARRPACGTAASPGSTHPADVIDGATTAVRRQLEALPRVYLEPLVLQCLDFSVAEIASVLDTTADAARAGLAAARQQLAMTSC